MIDFEVASALRGHALAGKLGEPRLAQALHGFGEFTIERCQMIGMLDRILGMRDDFTVYDAAYVVLAQGLGAP